MVGGAGIADFLDRQRPQWPCWLAVALMVGIAGYFSLPSEPALWWGPVIAAGAAAGAWRWRRYPFAVLPLIGLAVAALGFSIVAGRAALLQSPQLTRTLTRIELEGRIVDSELFRGSERITIGEIATPYLAPESIPVYARIRLTKIDLPFAVGDRIRLRADLAPPMPASMPGAFDFRRQAYFQRLGAVGFSLKPPVVLSRGARSAFADGLDNLRLAIAKRIRAVLPGPEGALAIALTVGFQGALPKHDVDAMRDSGLAHLLSISGLHIGLAAGLLFVLCRAILALIPPLALRFPIKKWAAILALGGALFYAGLAGWPVPTQRALIMTGIVFTAILFDRSPISFRLIAWAAIFILLVEPESLTGASFQMSFAAVAGLIAFYEAYRVRFQSWRRIGRDAADWPGRILGWSERRILSLVALALTSFVASLMTAPFAAYHFNRLSLYGILANMVAVPLTGALIMPCAILALLAMPFGLDEVPLRIMGWACGIVLDLAHGIADWQGAAFVIPALPRWGFGALVAGQIFLILTLGRLRWLGLIGIAIGALSFLAHPSPDLLVSGDGKLIAAKAQDGDYRFNSRRAARIAAETWLRRNGEDTRQLFPPGPDCNADFCRRETPDGRLGIAFSEAGIAPACAGARIIVSLEPLRGRCPEAAIRIDRFDLWREGAHALWFSGDGAPRILTVLKDTGDRPWALRRKPRPFAAPPAESGGEE